MTSFPSIALGASALAFALVFCALVPASAQPPGAPIHLALSALGDLTPYRTIASDTLALVDKGDIPAARARAKDLETAWDKAEPTLKPKDKVSWTAVDGMIDAALTDLRTPNPKPAACQASLKALMARLDGLDRG